MQLVDQNMEIVGVNEKSRCSWVPGLGHWVSFLKWEKTSRKPLRD